MSAPVQVDFEFLSGLTHVIRNTSMRLGAGASVPNCDLSRAPEVQQAWQELQRRFDENSARLVATLDAIADALDTVRDSFSESDDALANTLRSS